MRKLFTILLILGGTVLTLGQQADLDSSVKNSSPLKLQVQNAPKLLTDVMGATYCSGRMDTCLDQLMNIGISRARLQQSCQCTVGDFDGNGYLDFVIWGIDTTKKSQNNIIWPDYENYLALFFDGHRIIRTIDIKTEKGFPLVHYPPRTTVGPNGEPVTSKDAVWTWGQTGDYDDYSKGTVYIFEDNKFRLQHFGSTKAR